MAHNLYKYKKIGDYWRPLLPISLKNKDKAFSYLALLDSGADFNIFHEEIAEVLGLDLSDTAPIKIGGINADEPITGKVTKITLGIRPYENATICHYFSNEALVIFSPDISQNGYGVFGQLGFFEYFNIRMTYKTKGIKIGW